QWPSGWCSRHDCKIFEFEAISQDQDEGLSDSTVLPGGKNYARKRMVRSSQVEMDLADGVGSKSYHVVRYEELDGIPVALVVRIGVVSKSADRILVSHYG
nr:hypothetical protein [Tanacetum cinerariifolium]